MRLATTIALTSCLLSSIASAQLSRPVSCDTCIGNWFYFDHDAGGGRQDYTCNMSTYNGHRGSDFSLIGGNGAIATGYNVVAAQGGTVTRALDGFFDRCTACGGASCGLDFGGGFGNQVWVEHDGYVTIYAHLRQGSVRVSPGDRVECGDVIGQKQRMHDRRPSSFRSPAGGERRGRPLYRGVFSGSFQVGNARAAPRPTGTRLRTAGSDVPERYIRHLDLQ